MKLDWQGKQVAVLGLGVEGLSSVKFLVEQKAKVTVLDQKEERELDESSIKTVKSLGVDTKFGKNAFDNLSQFDAIIRSPGVKRNLSEITLAEKKGSLITSHTKIFFDLCPGKIIGITGTKGKGTTASLIYEMLENEGLDAYLGGNIGKPPLEFIDKLKPSSWVVLELSSFQLEDIDKSPTDAKALVGKPHIAVILMITSEHLGADTLGTQNYHETLEEYINAKRNLVRFQMSSDFAIVNRDYPASNESDIHTQAFVYQVSIGRGVIEQGCFVKDSAVWIKNKQSEVKIADISQVLLPGRHNLENVCAAVMAAYLAGVSKNNIASVLKTFQGLEHRLQLVGEISGVSYYDDSFSTTPETAIAAIEAFEKPEVLILGGSSKNSDFRELGEVISHSPNIKAIIGIGTEWPKIKKSIKYDVSGIKYIEGCKSMKEIAQAAFDAADPGDVVLLSPACASFDMFKNYKDRGEQFRREIEGLTHGHT